MHGNLEARPAALETQMQDMRDILQQTLMIVREASDIAKSNARSIQAWEARIEENKIEAEEELSRQAVMIHDLQETNRENVLQHMEFRQRFDETQATINRILVGLES
jgi:cyclopropane fatty-acyl-phospholipid synthase-like methyltransferase